MTDQMCKKIHFCPSYHFKFVNSTWCDTCEADAIFEQIIEPIIRVRRCRDRFLQNFQMYQLLPSRRKNITRFVVLERYWTTEPKYVTSDRAFFALDEYVKPLASAARAGNSTFAIICFLLRYFTSDASVVAFATRLTYMDLENLRIKL